MKPKNRDIAAKADIAVSDLVSNGGYLNPEQANRFIQMVTDQPTVLNQARRVIMGAPQRKIEKIGFGSRVLHGAPDSGTYLDDAKRAAPTTSKIDLATDEIMAEVHIPYDVLEDNIEKDNLENTIMSQLTAQIAMDLEEYLLLADTDLSATDDFLGLTDGVLKRIATNVVTMDGTSGNEQEMGTHIFKHAVKTIAPKYLRQRAAMRFFSSHKNEIDYRDVLAVRETGLGDQLTEGVRTVYAQGIPLTPAVMMPETTVLLTHPKNLIWGVQRDIMIETDKDIRSRVYIVVVTMRIAQQIENEEACVVVNGLTANT